MTVRLVGSTSGYVDLNAPAIAGTTTITMPASSGTLVVTGGTAPVQFPAGNVTNPSITSNVSSTAGVWFPSANTIAISTSSAEALRIDTSGNVGIGRAPNYQLDVYRSGTTQSTIAATNDNVVNTMYVLSNTTGVFGTITSHPIAFINANTEKMRITTGGEVYIAGTTDQGVYNLQVNGTGVWGAGAYVNGSDARIKDDIAPIDSCLSIVENLNPVTFRYKASWSKDQSIQPGFIAQELQSVLGGTSYVHGVVQRGTEYMSVAYQALIPVLTKALQEAVQKIDALEARIAALENA